MEKLAKSLIIKRCIKLTAEVESLEWVLDLIQKDIHNMSDLEEKIKKRINAFNIQIESDLKRAEEQ